MKKNLLSTLLILTCSMAFSQITLTSSVTNVSCYGGADGSITITATGGVAPYTYSWSPVAGNFPTMSGLTAGVYTVIVMDASTNMNTIAVAISEPQMLNIIMSQTNTTCYGTCDGAASCIATGGTPAYTYAWSNGYQTTQPTGLCAGAYSVTITDSKGCASSSTFTIISGPPNPNITVSSGAFFCSGISAILGVSGATSYTWSPAIGLNSTSGSTVIASPIATTIYTVAGSNGSCVSTASTQVTVYPSPSISFSLTPNATPHIWDITPTYTSSTGPYTYMWSFGDGSPNSTLPYPSHTYTTAGWYNICVTLTDNNGCASTFCQNDSLYRMSSSSSMITVNIINGSTTNINQSSIYNNSVSAYPNPVKNILNINLGELKENTEIKIYNAIGELVLTERLTAQKTLLNVYNLQSGIYFYHILVGEKSIKTEKMIIIK
jgi:hypothetical protein